MNELKTTILQVVIHREDSNPVFGKGNTYVSVEDDAAGPFLVIKQPDYDAEMGKIQLDFDELTAVVEAAKMLMHQMYIEKQALK